jgi:hypothetical protein
MYVRTRAADFYVRGLTLELQIIFATAERSETSAVEVIGWGQSHHPKTEYE